MPEQTGHTSGTGVAGGRVLGDGPESDGAGIGLFLVKHICDRLSWQISLHSDASAGTTVELRFQSS